MPTINYTSKPMNSYKRWGVLLVVLGMIGLTVVHWLAQAQSAPNYAAQLGGGSLAALAGGLVSTLAGGLSGGLLGVAVEFLQDPSAFYRETDELPLAVRWAFMGAKAGFGLGASLGAAAGVVHIAAASGVAGDPQGALIGAFIGGMLGMTILLDSVRPHLEWRFVQTREGLRLQGRTGFDLRLLLNPVTLAALGATIGYNLGAEKSNAAISVPLVALRF